jgi:lysophospholipase L1-like esterase
MARRARGGMSVAERSRMQLWQLLLPLGSILLVVVVADLVFRVITPTSPPGTTWGRAVHRNSDGLRDREFVKPKPEGVYRILLLGDSFTWGVGLDIEETISKRLERALAGQAHPIEVIDGAIPGFNTTQELRLLRNKGLSYEPDFLMLLYNMNDIEFRPELATQPYDAKKVVTIVEVDPDEKIEDFSKRKGLRAFIQRVQDHSPLVNFLVPRVGSLLRRLGVLDSPEFSWVARTFRGFSDQNPGWTESKIALASIKSIATERGIPFVVVIYPLLVELENYQGKNAHDAIRTYCESIGVPTIDLLPVFEHHSASQFWVNFMDPHPNAEAHALVSDYVLDHMRQHLPEWVTVPARP